MNDFLSPCVQSRAWMVGKDPYAPVTVAQLWPPDAGQFNFLEKESRDGSLPAKRGIPSPYPLPCFPLLFLFAMIRWRIANFIWIAVVTGSFVLALKSVMALANFELRSLHACLLVTAALAFAPFHTAIFTENPVLPVVALGMIAIISSRNGHYFAAAALLIPATALKPTVALPFLVYIFVRQRWRVVVPAGLGVGALLVLAQLRLTAAGVSWLPSFLRSSQKMFGPGGIDDFSSANPLRFDLLNLQVISFPFLGSRFAAQMSSWIAYAALLAVWLWSLRKKNRGREIGLLDLSILAATTLLPFYHRFYDAVLLLLPLAWAIANFHGEFRRHARICLILMTPFLLPGAALLNHIAAGTPLRQVSQTWWWNMFILPHEIWAVLLLSCVLLAAGWKASAQPAVAQA